MPEQTQPTISSVVSLEALENEKFVVGKVLRGGMGVVYQLVPVRTFGLPPIALKTYQQSVNRAQFIREAEVWISLGTHPHIARAILYTEWQSRPSIVAEWYEKSLAETDISKWPTPKFHAFVLQLVTGLSYAMECAKLVHQDIKPANILLDESDAPRITDFGLAKFAPEPAIPFRSAQDIQPNMTHTVSFQGIGGTLPYMAPEIFFGTPPSTRTDIFSLGVTLYQALTGQHPFMGAETGQCWQPHLRDAPLRNVLTKRGDEIRPLLQLIVTALELNAERRPASYSALLSAVGLRSLSPDVRHNDGVSDTVAKVGMLRQQGRYQEALSVSRNAIEDRPTNPILLNSHAILLKASGKEEEAAETWSAAVDVLRFTGGMHDHKRYIDPVVNLAAQMIRTKRFDKADALLSMAWEWVRDDSSNMELLTYQEFGWWYMYHGKFDKALQHILYSYQSKAPGEESLRWLTLAAWLSGNFNKTASKIAPLYLALSVMSASTAVCACVVAASVPGTLGKKLLETAYRNCAADLATVKHVRSPLDRTAQHVIMQSLELVVTGGRFTRNV